MRQLHRQIGSLLYERTGLSKHKAAVLRRAERQEAKENIEELIRDSYLLKGAARDVVTGSEKVRTTLVAGGKMQDQLEYCNSESGAAALPN